LELKQGSQEVKEIGQSVVSSGVVVVEQVVQAVSVESSSENSALLQPKLSMNMVVWHIS